MRGRQLCHLSLLCADWLSVLSPAPVFYVIVIYFTHVLLACPDLCDCPGSSNQVSCVDAGLTEMPRDLSPSLTTLDLTQNQLHSLSASDLAALRSVVNLKLKDNRIETIHNGAFEPLQSLQTLELGGNELTGLTPFTFQGVSSLLHLDLSDNSIVQIDGAFSGMAELSRLDLKKNLITEISQDTFSDLTNLRYLLLAENRIVNIDRKAFKNMEKLTYLVLKGNPIGQVSRFQFNSYYLSYVDLSECALTQIPRGLPNSIRYLQLRRNNITVIRRQSFQDCPFVSILVLDDNGIVEINNRTFEHMTYLQQLWLNNNHLRQVPANLPTSLQRLLMDQNSVEYVSNVFPDGSKLHTLSLMGNNISSVAYNALGNLPILQSVDLSNNHLEHIYGHTFINSSRIETLQLSKNPLQYFHSRCFHGLSSLQTLSLAYIPTVVSIHTDSFNDLKFLTKLDLDSSHWIIESILSKNDLLSALATVEDLSLQSSDLTSLRPDFFDFFPELGMFHISSTRWHCDSSLIFLRNWLLTTKVRVEDRDDITCLTPHDLYGRSITSLVDHEFVPTTTLKHSTALPTAPGRLSTFPTTLFPPSSPTRSRSTTSSPEVTTVGSATATTSQDDFYYYDNKDGDQSTDLKPVDPFDIDLPDKIYGSYGGEMYSSRYPTWEEIMHPISKSTEAPADTPYNPNGVEGGNLQIRPLPDNELGAPTLLPKPKDTNKDPESNSTSTLIIIISTTIATLVIAGILIFVIVYLSRKNRDKRNNKRRNKTKQRTKRKKELYQNGIKYKSRNDVLYFMPKNADGSTSESLKTEASKEAMSLVPGRDINHEGPLRVYKWEDF